MSRRWAAALALAATTALAVVAACGGSATGSPSSAELDATPGPGPKSKGGADLPYVTDGGPDGAVDCSPAGGVYQRGKNGGAPECCAGLNERDVLVEDIGGIAPDGGNIVTCDQIPLANFTCTQGTCGDGICEAIERQPCVCPTDCADAGADGG